MRSRRAMRACIASSALRFSSIDALRASSAMAAAAKRSPSLSSAPIPELRFAFRNTASSMRSISASDSAAPERPAAARISAMQSFQAILRPLPSCRPIKEDARHFLRVDDLLLGRVNPGTGKRGRRKTSGAHHADLDLEDRDLSVQRPQR